MSEEQGTSSANGRPPDGLLGRIAGGLASLKFALPVLLLIALACVIGTLLPQGLDVQEYMHEHPDAVTRMKVFTSLGLTHVFSAWWFIALLGLFAASLAVCTIRRFNGMRRRHGHARLRAIGSTLTHISLLLILAGGVIRGIWGERGQLAFHEGETKDSFSVQGTEEQLPFAVHLVKFEIETYAPAGPPQETVPKIVSEELRVAWHKEGLDVTLPVELNADQVVAPAGEEPGTGNTLHVNILQRIPDFVIDMSTREVTSRSDEPNNPAILVEVVKGTDTNSQWLFARYPDFGMHASGSNAALQELHMQYRVRVTAPAAPRIKDYKSTLQILDGETVLKEKTIEVNSPLSYGGYTFYQTGYNPEDPDWTSLQVVRDPGVPVVYTGFVLMIVGLAMTFYMYPAANKIVSSDNGQEGRPS